MEVFRTKNLDEIVEKCDEFFSLMPKLVEDDDTYANDAAQQQGLRATGDPAVQLLRRLNLNVMHRKEF